MDDNQLEVHSVSPSLANLSQERAIEKYCVHDTLKNQKGQVVPSLIQPNCSTHFMTQEKVSEPSKIPERLSNESCGAERCDCVADESSEKVNVFSEEISEKKMKHVCQVVESDIMGSDLKCSIFIAACKSYRYNSCLYPYPPGFVRNKELLYEKLMQMNESLPPLRGLNEFFSTNIDVKLNSYTVNVLHWLLIELMEPCLLMVPKEKHDAVLGKVTKNISVKKPSAIFQLVHKSHSVESKWERVKKGFNTRFAFHGSRLDNFHSILHYGLCHHLTNKELLFGPGIYLSSELSLSLHYSPTGISWANSIIGSKICIVALVEFVDHPTVGSKKKGRNPAVSCSTKEDPPQKYYIVPNADLVRVRYLLVYVTSPPKNNSKPNASLQGWFGRNKLLLFLIGYALLLVFIGLPNSLSWTEALRKIRTFILRLLQ